MKLKSLKPSIYFHAADQSFTLKNKKKIETVISTIFNIEKVPLQELHYIFCSDEYLLKLNLSYLDHETYTDVITFTLSDTGAPVFGEIYISIDRVKENAKLFNTSFLKELHRVMFHGALHLCGYADKTKEETQKMRAKENFYLKQYASL